MFLKENVLFCHPFFRCGCVSERVSDKIHQLLRMTVVKIQAIVAGVVADTLKIKMKKEKKKKRKKKKKKIWRCLQHLVFPGGHPPQY